MCGIVGMVGTAPVNQDIYDALLLLQHRGQDATGIATAEPNGVMHNAKAQGMVREAFRTRDVVQLLDVTRRQLQYWAQTDLIAPSAKTPGGHGRYTFEDLVALKAAKRLIDAGVSVQRIRKSIGALRQILPTVQRPLAELVLVATGDVVLAQTVETYLAPMRRPEIDAAINEVYRWLVFSEMPRMAGGSYRRRRLTMPILYAFGAEDRPLTADFVRRQCGDRSRFADHLEITEVPGAAHFMTDDDPGAVQDLLRDFFARAG